MDDAARTRARADRLRAIGDTMGETAEALGHVESRLVETVGEFAGEATRVLGSAAARTADELRPGSGDVIDAAADATARAVEATGRMAGTVLDAGGIYAHDVSEAATDAAEELARSADDAEVPPPPGYVGPS